MKLKGSCHCQAVQFECESHTPYPFMRCYCSICRKTAGGGGYAINIMGLAKSLKVNGKRFITIYHAHMTKKRKGQHVKVSTGQRHFCKKCGSYLWVFDPEYPDLMHPFASAIDTPLPIPPNEVYLMLDFKASWCVIPKDKKIKRYKRYPKLSIEEWHKQNHLWVK